MNEDISGKKDKFTARSTNKRYLSKKKRFQEKTEIAKIEVPVEHFLPENGDTPFWRVAEIRSGISHKTLACISAESGETKLLEIPLNSPFFGQVVIGDYVNIDDDSVTGIITRKNLLARYKGDQSRFSLHSRTLQSIAANLDALVIIASAKDPEFQPGFIDRYMVLAERSGIPPIICITKSDLKPIDDPVLHWYEQELGISVVHTSTVSKVGMEQLKDVISGKTVAFVGKSGVGKSSLTNALLEQELSQTSKVSDKGGEGRHTTTSSKLFAWKTDSYIVDTPGIRSLEFLELSPEELIMYFSEFTSFSKDCRYRDCIHHHETDCSVKSAVEKREIPDFRYRTYVRLLEEVR